MSYHRPTFFTNFISFFVIKEFYFLWIELYATYLSSIKMIRLPTLFSSKYDENNLLIHVKMLFLQVNPDKI